MDSSLKHDHDAEVAGKGFSPAASHDEEIVPLEDPSKPKTMRLWPVFACGAGLLSDGYLQAVIGPVNTCLKKIYGPEYTNSTAQSNVSSLAFAGTVVGQLVFGYTSDVYSRKWSMMISTSILFVFAALGAGAYGAGGSANGLFSALAAYRFLLGIGIGGEYPAGSVAAAESTGEIKSGSRNRWFALATNVQLDIGFVVGYIVPMIVAAASPNLELIWRLSLAMGVLIPLTFLFLRSRLKEPEAYRRNKKAKTPWVLGLKFYWSRLLRVAVIWFIYDFLTYPFSIFSSDFVDTIQPDQALWQTFGWSALINLFYLVGAIPGAFTSDWLGPRKALIYFLLLQAIIGFIMAGCYYYLGMAKNIGAFVVIYGLFLAVGEMGPGDNIGLVASKTSATPIRGVYYGIAAATGKIGGFVGNYIFPYLIAAGGKDKVLSGQIPFFFSCGLIIISAIIAFTLPEIGQDTIDEEDIKFNRYLAEHGWRDE